MSSPRPDYRHIKSMASRLPVVRPVVAATLPPRLPAGWWVLPSAAIGLASYAMAALVILQLG